MYKDIILSTPLVKNMAWTMLRINRNIENGKLENVVIKNGIFNGKNSYKVKTIYNFDIKKAKKFFKKILNLETCMLLFFVVLIIMLCHDTNLISKQKQVIRQKAKIEFCQDFYSHQGMYDYCINDFKPVGINK